METVLFWVLVTISSGGVHAISAHESDTDCLVALRAGYASGEFETADCSPAHRVAVKRISARGDKERLFEEFQRLIAGEAALTSRGMNLSALFRTSDVRYDRRPAANRVAARRAWDDFAGRGPVECIWLLDGYWGCKRPDRDRIEEREAIHFRREWP